MVERQPSKLNVASSTLVSRSIFIFRGLKLNKLHIYGDRSSVGRAPVCGTGCRGFKSRRSPHNYEPLAQSVEHLTFNQGVTGSIPVWLTILKFNNNFARVAKLVYALDLGSSVFDMWVRVPPFAPFEYFVKKRA